MYSEIIASYTPCLIQIAVAYKYYRSAQICKVAVECSLQRQCKSLVCSLHKFTKALDKHRRINEETTRW